ncbi:MAG TPA: hypothetical protein VFN75_09460 [Pseudonocardiaceae bacterium]|nr:hypothetical protein [Pseudonocardiaceae bacterium]
MAIGSFVSDETAGAGADPAADVVSYQQGTLWFSPENLAELINDMRVMLQARASRSCPRRAMGDATGQR